MTRRMTRRQLLAALDDARAVAEAQARALHEARLAAADREYQLARVTGERDEARRHTERAEATTARLLVEHHRQVGVLVERHAASLLSIQTSLGGPEVPAIEPARRAAIEAGPAPEPPEWLRSGHAVFAGDPDVLHQIIDGPLPAGTNGRIRGDDL